MAMGLSKWPLLTHEENRTKRKRERNEVREFPGSSRRKKVQDSLSHGFNLSLRMLHFSEKCYKFRGKCYVFVVNVTHFDHVYVGHD